MDSCRKVCVRERWISYTRSFSTSTETSKLMEMQNNWGVNENISILFTPSPFESSFMWAYSGKLMFTSVILQVLKYFLFISQFKDSWTLSSLSFYCPSCLALPFP